MLPTFLTNLLLLSSGSPSSGMRHPVCMCVVDFGRVVVSVFRGPEDGDNRSSEISVNIYETTRCHIAECSNRICSNFRYYGYEIQIDVL
jgi:hypothetical protein